ncbi:MAG: succinate dehydrogenase, hydrophobic membrane anchor protein [Sulfurimicrobium sp.]|jgi:succinate dehydrogenase / fumarate reductase membrane anchor subunit|nr:succinate dehydrogenase, hydrophobic membrane anchor protein [Sulfurimicrobium sp.]MDP1897590.1 succinate dehydrogenase, hydrophobic membrane anchor protein [Sulfurimicrobium sp.]MDP2199912.1 succinate dehydrogenase, hydrophobic membrane anchor protein [Sulfurimicrobium sp.]MDP2963149.1 succinate dehydrogenase, hydrophobic membrane anchor protein [Sulfurimicrobium sp.]MDP3688672.1 succinate dehydrogenase, hydrophobic membrane anchor protein [Sulfurimicrobium sp.]
MVKRIVSGAHYGLKDWLTQRITAVVMAFYSLFLIGFFLTQPLSFASWHGLFHSLPVRLASMLFLFSVLLHAWVGMRDIFMDYVHPTVLRLALHVSVILALLAYAAWAVQILWGA